METWFFRDRQNNVQGPFTGEEMRAWYEAGYLNADLEISRDRVRFNPLKEWFPNAINAFLPGAANQGAPGGGAGAGAAQWYFVDKSNKVQGPFADVQMRQWHMAGYFEPTLQIMNNAVPGAQWQLLRDTFPNMHDAFIVAPGSGATAQPVARPEQTQALEDRFNFPEWLPVPPKFRGYKKIYPSEKNGTKRNQVNITDVHGQAVQGFAHARARAPT